MFSLFNLAGCKADSKKQYKNKPGRFFLTDWTYSLDQSEFKPVSVDDFTELYKLVPGGKGFITLQTTFTFPKDYMFHEVGINFGSVSIAAKFAVNGEVIETAGSFPPNTFFAGKQSHCIKIPEKAIFMNEPITVEIVLWVEGTGGINGIPLVAPLDDVYHVTDLQTFLFSKINLGFAVAMMFTMICFYSMYLKNRKEKEYMSFALMNWSTAFYLLPYYIMELPVSFSKIHFLSFMKIFEGLIVIATCYYTVSFIRDILKYTETKKIWRIRLYTMIVSVILISLIPTIRVYFKLQIIIYLLGGLQILMFCVKPLYFAFREKNKNLNEVIVGFSPVLLGLLIDFITKIILQFNMLPLFTIYGWQLSVIMFLVITSFRYANFRRQAEYLNSKLEKEVEDRTADLTKANSELQNKTSDLIKANRELEFRHNQDAQDMALAVQVQKSFYPHDTDFLGWDSACLFEPYYGVSGDLYDFYILEGKLRGFGLFDVSGHGISSGLVTMLAKNAIFHSFRTTLTLPLSKAVDRINESVIRTKGDIENYLVGSIVRIDKDDSSKLELINAGGPHPIYKSGKTNKAKLIMPSSKKPHYGMLGVEGLDVKFQTLKITMKTNDVLVLYTDGLTETENSKGEQYGNERLRSAIEKASGSAKEILDCIINDYSAFAGTKVPSDDITILIMKKTEELTESDDFGILDEVFDEEEQS